MLGSRITNQDEEEVEDELAALAREIAGEREPPKEQELPKVPDGPLPQREPETEDEPIPARQEQRTAVLAS